MRTTGGRTSARRDLLAVLAPAAVVPVGVYGAFLTQVPLDDLLWENLYPRDYVAAAGHVIFEGHAPLTGASFAELAGRTLAYAAGVAGLLALAAAIDAGGRRRRFAVVAVAIGALAFLIVLVQRPDTVRHYLQWAWAWMPLGAWIAVAWMMWRTRGTGQFTGDRQAALLIVLLTAAIATPTYAAFLPIPNALFPDATPYLLPVAAVFMAWLHVCALPQGRPSASALGAGWLALLALAGGALVVHDARAETEVVVGPNGSLAARPAEAAALQGALDHIARETRPGEPILLAPQLSALYVMSGRPNPLPQLSLLPGILATAADQDEAIARMSNVSLAVVDRTKLTLYGHGSFGETFAERLDEWLRRNFHRTATVRGHGTSPRVLDVWIRSSP
jgi:hypothetical protein